MAKPGLRETDAHFYASFTRYVLEVLRAFLSPVKQDSLVRIRDRILPT